MARWMAMVLAGTMLGGVMANGAAEPGQRQRQFSWRKAPASLALMNGDRVIWQFNHLQDGKEKGCPYFHPLATTEGAVLTDLRPGDHLWHRGLRFAWKIINGLDGYWTWPEEQDRSPDKALGHTDVTAVKVAANDDFSARFELEITYHPPDAPADLTEKRVIEVSAPDANGDYRIDWRGVFTAGAKGAVLDRTPILGEPDGKWFGGYAGLQFRLAHHDQFSTWTISNSDGISVTSDSDTITAETRQQLEPLHGKPARWVDLTLDMADGKKGGATIIDHPGNLRHPPPWHIAAMPHEFHHAPLFNGPFTLESGKTLPLRFRIVVHSGPLQKAAATSQWEDFIRQP
ncbi:MAG: PmoA family protein [Verrucomicrobiae bacterium]|nr:PmoA family protein [Verrucomicrobiae bacterium]